MENLKEKEIILPEDDRAAKLTTVKGWVSRSGRFWGNDERMARWEGSTHKKCECGQLMGRDYTRCHECQDKKSIEAYYKMPFKEWDGKVALYDDASDRYFFDEESVREYHEDEGLELKDARLIICEPNYLRTIEYDYWDDCLPEDGDLPEELVELVEKVNEYCRKSKPISWSPGKYRTEIK